MKWHKCYDDELEMYLCVFEIEDTFLVFNGDEFIATVPRRRVLNSNLLRPAVFSSSEND